MTPAPDHSDLFLAVLTFVPVLWITTGFASEAARRLVVRIRDAQLTVKFSPRWPPLLPGTRLLTLIVEPDRVLVRFKKYLWWGPIRDRSLLEAPGQNLASQGLARAGVVIYVASGVIAETLSLFALYQQGVWGPIVHIVFASALLTLLMTAVVVATTLGAVFADTFVEHAADD